MHLPDATECGYFGTMPRVAAICRWIIYTRTSISCLLQLDSSMPFYCWGRERSLDMEVGVG